MKNNQAALYTVIGILVGVIVMLAFFQLPAKMAAAAAKTDALSGAAGDYIAIATQTRSENNILWVLNAKTNTLAIYEYTNEDTIRYKAARDIEYDMDLPSAFSFKAKARDLTPAEVRDETKKYRDSKDAPK
ncbi:MAG: hypothetical protein WC980_04235 [Candidatus Brocadiia bacterium]